MENEIVLLCSGCNSFKFVCENEWKKDEETVVFLKKLQSLNKLDIKYIICSDCTPEKADVHSELQEGDRIEESSPKCEQT